MRRRDLESQAMSYYSQNPARFKAVYYGARAGLTAYRNRHFLPALTLGAAGIASGINAGYKWLKGTKSTPPQRVQQVSIVPRKKTKRVLRRPKNLKKQVKQLQKQMNANTSTLTYRYLDCFKVNAAANQAAYGERSFNIPSTLELALAQLRFFDPANPGTLVNASGATGTYSRTFLIKSAITYKIRNNYQVPVLFKLYKFKCKADTNIDSNTAFTNGLADIGNPASTSIAVYPTDSPLMSDLYKLEKCTTWMLKPGQEKTYTVYTKSFDYDPSDYDSHSLTYQKSTHSYSMLFRVAGVPAHDKTTNTQLGTIASGVDVLEKQTYIIKYNSGGADLNYLYVSDNLDSMTAGPVVSQVVVDNQEYSAA